MSDKPSCETCSKRATDICPLSTVANNIGRHGDYERIVSVFRIVGCASHPQAREYLMADVLKELEEESNDELIELGIRTGYRNAMNLIKNGVEK